MHYPINYNHTWEAKSDFFIITTSRLEPRLVYMHTQKPKKIISNARLYSRFYGNQLTLEMQIICWLWENSIDLWFVFILKLLKATSIPKLRLEVEIHFELVMEKIKVFFSLSFTDSYENVYSKSFATSFWNLCLQS